MSSFSAFSMFDGGAGSTEVATRTLELLKFNYHLGTSNPGFKESPIEVFQTYSVAKDRIIG